MYLTSKDIEELKPLVQDGKSLNPIQHAEVVTRQIRNIISRQDESALSALLNSISDWRFSAILLPILVLIGSILVLARSYPSAVFLWGDAEEWYRNILNRRAWVWNVIIGALLVGLVGNIAIFGISSFFSPRS